MKNINIFFLKTRFFSRNFVQIKIKFNSDLVLNHIIIIQKKEFILKTCVITGCAGFIGSNLCDFLLSKNWVVKGIDNLVTGKIEFINNALENKNFTFYEEDLLTTNKLNKIFENTDFVFHFAANADVRFGIDNPYRDFRQNTEVTLRILEAMKDCNVPNIVFSSTGSVYGEASVIPTPENHPFPIQTSMYGTSKVAAEGFITSFSEAYGIKSWIFRFVSILGERYSHGHVYDFIYKLQKDPHNIEILGDGNQRKSYLNVKDCILAINHAINSDANLVNIYNLGTDDYCKVDESLTWICQELNLNPKRSYTGGERGWIGDNPFIYLDTNKIKSLGWAPKSNIKQSIIETVQYLIKNQWVFDNMEIKS